MGVNEHELASWGRRLAALLVDFTVLILVIATALLAAGVQEAIYYTALIGSRSQTLGKMALGIRVVDAESRSPIGYTRAFSRWLSTATFRAFFTIPTVIDHLWPLRDPRNQALHDKFARSVVVRT